MKTKKSEGEVIKETSSPNTITTLKRDFKTLGITAGSVIIMHSSLSKIGWTVGGSVSIIKAIMERCKLPQEKVFVNLDDIYVFWWVAKVKIIV